MAILRHVAQDFQRPSEKLSHGFHEPACGSLRLRLVADPVDDGHHPPRKTALMQRFQQRVTVYQNRWVRRDYECDHVSGRAEVAGFIGSVV